MDHQNNQNNADKNKINQTNEPRFTLLVEASEAVEEQEVTVTGVLAGQAAEKQAVYLYHPGMPLTLCGIKKIEPVSDGGEEGMVKMTLESKGKLTIPKYAVVSNIPSNQGVDLQKPTENPELRGALTGYKRFRTEKDYMGLLMYRIAHARFVMAEYDEGEFPLLTNPDGTKFVPAFTDEEKLSAWKGVFDEDNPYRVASNKFQLAAGISFRGNAGMVINPFSNSPLLMPNEVLQGMMRTPGYQQEFGNPAGSGESGKPVENAIRLAIPKESEQLNRLKDILKNYGETHEQVRSIYMMAKLEEGNQWSYFCIMDIDMDSVKEIFPEVQKEVAPILEKGQRMNYAIKAGAFEQVDQFTKPLYRK